MECHMAGVNRCAGKQCSWFSWPSPNMDYENIYSPKCNMHFYTAKMGSKCLTLLRQVSTERYTRRDSCRRMFAIPINLVGEPSSSSPKYSRDGDKVSSNGSSDSIAQKKLGGDELKSLLVDSQRANLINKLSQANQHNRHLKRQLQIKEDELDNFKSELAVVELEVQALVKLAEEIAKSGIPPGSRRINGKYTQSHLLSRLQAVQVKLKEQVKDVNLVQSKEVSLFWSGMAESVQVMGSFDGWSEGQNLSPQEDNASFVNFSTTLMLRPGRYEIKFLVDGEWHLSSELPIVNDGFIENNLLIVE